LDEFKHIFGERELVEVEPKTDAERRVYAPVATLNAELAGQQVWVRGRIHRSKKASGSLCFILLRDQISFVQVVVEESEKAPKAMVNWVSKMKNESIVDIFGLIKKVDAKVEAATQQDVEVVALQVYRISGSEKLPILVEDCMRNQTVLDEQAEQIRGIEAELNSAVAKLAAETDAEAKKKLEEEIEALKKQKETATKFTDVDQSQRLDNRVIDLRTPANIAIFKIQSGVCRFFREFLHSRQFIEIHSPKLISAASEGGSDVFEVSYFSRKAYLAQSPQFYKQMAITADFERVFEIGPVFRAEKSFTHRHLTEFTGLDLEMTFKQHYHEVMNLIGDMFIYIFKGIETHHKKELEVFSQQYPFEPLKFSDTPLRITFAEGVALLREAGEAIGDFDDISTPQEKKLGRLVKEKYNTEFYMMDRYPSAVRPFYTMPAADDANYSNSYDMFIRGEEVLSGAQRVHDAELLAKQVAARGINVASIQPYIDAFKFGAPPHAGGGVGLERVVMLYLNTHNIRKSTLFPRDPQRLSP
jgi:aspartyl-tRNA synthetase